MGYDFRVVVTRAEEVHNEELTGTEVAQVNAYRKARVVARDNPDALVIGADTVVHMGQRLFGKPADLEDAARMIMELQGKVHNVVTAVCLLHLRSHKKRAFTESTAVRFHNLTEKQIRQYLKYANPMDKAGSYGIQERGELIVSTIEGSLTNVVGLPVERLAAELQAWDLKARRVR